MPLRPASICCCWVLACSATAAAQQVEFNRDVRPILADKCFACHGPDKSHRQAELRLDIAEGAYAEREGKFALKPGDLKASEAWVRLTSNDPDVAMPPPDSKKVLTTAQKDLIKRWIEQGAKYQKHWAFEPPVKAAAPAATHADWSQTAIDRFLLARLNKEGLKPSLQADKPTLIRRVAFALTGLPPSVTEVDDYMQDASPDAYEKMVDRYLASPRYGEEMARHWLDVARYADTHGLHLDNERQMWAYRDWVVQAFNENLPFDRFTEWQLAGDLLPNPTPRQLAATGFNRCNVTTSEGGAINAEFLYRYAVERTSTMTQAWLGLTGGCAVCHDHKYDPISTKEFYSLYAFFYSAADPAMDGNINVTAPFVKMPRPDQKASLEAAIAAEKEALAALERAAAICRYDDPAKRVPPPERMAVVDVLFDDYYPQGSSQRNTSRNAPEWDAADSLAVPVGRRALKQANSKFHEDVVTLPPSSFAIPHDAKLSVWLRTDAFSPPQAVSLQVAANGFNKRFIWGDADALDGKGAAGTIEMGPLPKTGEWTKLEFTSPELAAAAGKTVNSFTLQEAGGIAWWDGLAISGASDPAADPLVSFAAWWKSLAGKSPAGIPGEMQKLVKEGPDKEHSAELVDKLRQFYLAQIARPANDELAKLRRAWEDAHSARAAVEDSIVGTFVYNDVEKPREAFVMLRGQYDKQGEKVTPGVPAVFPSLKVEKADARPTRLDLARWLLSSEHPLTARVTVNRLWQQFFGTGLVKTSYDFGSQGEPPSHPELLDWLAIDFREQGWNVKRLARMLVTSAAFRQESAFTPELRERDPENRLYARGPRFRLDAEQIRDNVLFTSGLINLTMGGKGVKGYQPPNIWEPVGYGDSNTRYYLQDHGDALYRRSLYCFLKRTAPPPFMTNFDGPNREQFCTRRERSNTPLQALQLLNDVQHFEAARALAERAIAEAGKSPAERLAFLYRTVLSREPSESEAKLLIEQFNRQRQLFEGEPLAAQQAIAVGESKPRNLAPAPETAAWIMMANLILNLDETVTRN